MDEPAKWLKRAQKDLSDAEFNLRNRRLEIAIFLSHQAAEKALKALQIRQLERFDKVHDLVALSKSVEAPAEMNECCIALTPYYTITRYPDAEEKITENIAKGMFSNGKKVFVWVKEKLNR